MVPKLSLTDKVKKFISLNPVLVRGVLVSIAAILVLVAKTFGIDAINDENTAEWVDRLVNAFVAISALITALLARGKVIAENKVIAWKPDPEGNVIAAGPAQVTTNVELAQVERAAIQSKSQAEIKSEISRDAAYGE